MKKSLIVSFAVLLSTLTLFAQSPQGFRYQAIARDVSGQLLSDQELGIRISLLRGSDSGEETYIETHLIKSNEFGLFNVLIGQGTTEKGNFTEIDWGANSYWVKVEMDIDGGRNYEIMGASALYSVPYALYAKQAGTLSKPDYENPKPIYGSDGSIGRTLLNDRSSPNSRIRSNSNSWLNANVGNVGIGISAPESKLHLKYGSALIEYAHTASNSASLIVNNQRNVIISSSSSIVAVIANATSNTDDDKFGIKAVAAGMQGKKYGVYARAVSSWTSDPDNKYAVYGTAFGHNANIYGVYGKADGSGGTKYGIYGEASGEGVNWAGFFDGRLHVNDLVGLGTTLPEEHLEIYGENDQIIKIISSNHLDVGIEFIRVGNQLKDWRIVDSVGHFYFLYSGDDFATTPATG